MSLGVIMHLISTRSAARYNASNIPPGLPLLSQQGSSEPHWDPALLEFSNLTKPTSSSRLPTRAHSASISRPNHRSSQVHLRLRPPLALLSVHACRFDCDSYQLSLGGCPGPPAPAVLLSGKMGSDDEPAAEELAGGAASGLAPPVARPELRTPKLDGPPYRLDGEATLKNPALFNVWLLAMESLVMSLPSGSNLVNFCKHITGRPLSNERVYSDYFSHAAFTRKDDLGDEQEKVKQAAAEPPTPNRQSMLYGTPGSAKAKAAGPKAATAVTVRMYYDFTDAEHDLDRLLYQHLIILVTGPYLAVMRSDVRDPSYVQAIAAAYTMHNTSPFATKSGVIERMLAARYRGSAMELQSDFVQLMTDVSACKINIYDLILHFFSGAVRKVSSTTSQRVREIADATVTTGTELTQPELRRIIEQSCREVAATRAASSSINSADHTPSNGGTGGGSTATGKGGLCSRCGKHPSTAGDCKALFRSNGARVNGCPPGLNKGQYATAIKNLSSNPRYDKSSDTMKPFTKPTTNPGARKLKASANAVSETPAFASMEDLDERSFE